MTKSTVSFFIICMFSLCSLLLPADSRAEGSWPVTPYKAICADEARSLIFYASGDTVLILEKGDLTQKSLIRVASNHGKYGFEGIYSIFYHAKDDEKRLYLALGYQGLRVYDINDPENPLQLFDDYYNEPAIETEYSGTKVRASDVAVDDQHIYITDYMYGIRLLNHELSIDEENKGFETPSLARIELAPGYIYVLKQNKGLGILRKNPKPPFFEMLGFFDIPSKYVGISGASDLQVNGDYAYVSNVSEDKIHFIDISDKIAPKEIATYSSEEYGSSVSGLFVSGDILYMADSESGMEVIDILDPSIPGDIIGAIGAKGAHSVYADSSNISYLADCTYGLRKIDGDIKETHYIPRPAASDRVFSKDDYGYTVDGNGPEEGLRIFRLADDTGINLLGFIATPGNASAVFVSGNFAYIADGDKGVAIIDITTPTEPVIVNQVATDGMANDVFISGNYAYIADGSNGVVIVDITTPTNPGTATVLKTIGDATGLFVSDIYAYIVTGPRITIADISDPTSPVVTGSTIETTGTPHKVYIHNDYAYIADGTNGMVVVKLFGSLAPQVVTTYPADDDGIVDICGSGNYLYLARGDKGCSIVDISAPANPQKITDVASTSSVSGVHISDNMVLLAEGKEGLSFFAQYEETEPYITMGMEQSTPSTECFIKSVFY